MTSISFNIRGDSNEFEDEPEDELASRGMHIVEGDDEDEVVAVEAVVAGEEPEALEDAVIVEVDEDAEAKEKEYKDGLEELEEMERTYVQSSAPSFGSAEEPDEV